MSVHISAWLWTECPVRLNPTQLVVALALADHANSENGLAWPGVPRVATFCRISERTVQRTLAELVKAGVIRVHKPATNRAPTVYVFPAFSGVTDCHPKDSRGDIAMSPEPSYTPTYLLPTSEDTPVSQQKPKSKRTREKKTIPEDFSLDPRLREETMNLSGWDDATLARRVTSFVTYHLGEGTQSNNWRARWLGYVNSRLERDAEQKQKSTRKETPGERMAREGQKLREQVWGSSDEPTA